MEEKSNFLAVWWGSLDKITQEALIIFTLLWALLIVAFLALFAVPKVILLVFGGAWGGICILCWYLNLCVVLMAIAISRAK